MYQIHLEKFEGPLALLLEMVEAEKLDITEVALAQVTESYLNYLNNNPGISEDEMADFLVTAAKLLYIKSKVLLPELNVGEEDGVSLADQLRMYKEFVEAAKKIDNAIKKKHFAYYRETPIKLVEVGFAPPTGLSAPKMKNMFEDVLARLKPILDLPRVMIGKAISIREKIQQIRDMLSAGGKLGFGHLLGKAQNRTEVIVSFLALLELTKQREIYLAQQNNFEEILIEKII